MAGADRCWTHPAVGGVASSLYRSWMVMSTPLGAAWAKVTRPKSLSATTLTMLLVLQKNATQMPAILTTYWSLSIRAWASVSLVLRATVADWPLWQSGMAL